MMGQMMFVGSSGAKYGRSQVPTYKKDFAPRLGLAFHVAPKWVVRAGFGIAYAPSAFQAAGGSGGAGVEGFQSDTGWTTSLDNNHTAVQTLANAFFVGGPNPINFPLGAKGGASTDLGYSVQQSYFTAIKSTYSEHRFNGQFRTEWFNVLNKPQFGGPGTSFGSGNFGQITSMGGGDSVRVIQMAANNPNWEAGPGRPPARK
jgi:hypothetical protein